MDPIFFESPAEFRKWLARNHASADEVWVGYRKKATGLPSMTWPESVDEALCWGWIDGIRKSVDADSYAIRFTPRRKGSHWSQVNLRRVQALIAEKRMRPPGLAAYESRDERRSKRYSFERATVALDPAYERKFRRRRKAWAFFVAQPPGYRKQVTWWIMSAKREETRARRLNQLIEDSAAGSRMREVRRLPGLRERLPAEALPASFGGRGTAGLCVCGPGSSTTRPAVGSTHCNGVPRLPDPPIREMKRSRRRHVTCGHVVFVLGTVTLLLSCADDHEPTGPSDQSQPAAAFPADVPLAWFDLALALTEQTAGYTPPPASRAFAYLGIAAYEAVAPGVPGHRSLTGMLNGGFDVPDPEHGAATYYWPAVANAALAGTARLLYPAAAIGASPIDGLERGFEASFARRIDPSLLERSVSRGRTIANAVFAYSVRDGGHDGQTRNFPASYVPPTGAGYWVPTPRRGGLPPLPALQPYWGGNRPFLLAESNPTASCAPAGHPPFSTDPESDFYREAAEVYDAVVDATAEEIAIARFWADDPGATPTPPGHSIAILNLVLEREEASLALAAESFARVGIAVADAFIATWRTKYDDNLLRPITYIREHIDPGWQTIVETPPFPEYTSGHSVQSGAAFEVMAALFGDAYAFDDRTHVSRGLPVRHFASFSAAAEEAALSRLYGGIHFRAAIEDGLEQGRCIGRIVAALPLAGG